MTRGGASVKVFLAKTDSQWVELLAARGDLAQANFWLPSPGQGFHAIAHGDIFLFKSKADRGGRIVGGGIFDSFVRARITDAWEWFGADNGVASPSATRRAVHAIAAASWMSSSSTPRNSDRSNEAGKWMPSLSRRARLCIAPERVFL